MAYSSNSWGELAHTETDEQGIVYSLYISPDEISVVGNALASGDNEIDAQAEAEILTRLASGDTWAWASVTVTARYKDLEWFGSDSLGACSYKNAAQFMADWDGNKTGYWFDMKREAKAELLRILYNAKVACDELQIDPVAIGAVKP